MAPPLNDLPRLSMGAWPTPVVRLERVSELLGREVWAKLEERCGAWGGNKVRKLEHWLAHARAAGRSELVTLGAGTSSWTAAVALHGRRCGFEVTLGLAGPVPDDYEKLYAQAGVRSRRLPDHRLLPLLYPRLSARSRAGGALFLPAGGSGGWGDVGSARAGIEIGEAMAGGVLPGFERVYVAAGTGGTCAGLAVGLGMTSARPPVVAVRVTPKPLGTAGLARARVRALLRFLARRGVEVGPGSPAPIAGEAPFYAPGYGVAGPAARAAIELAAEDGLELDATYAAKGFAALVEAARSGAGGPLLFVATSPGPLPRSE